MSLIVFGLNHKSAPVAIREQLAHLNAARIPGVNGETLESVPLCTCNRAEVYYSGNIEEARNSFNKLLKTRNFDFDKFNKYFYTLQNQEAINHLFSVASGIDSMVLGENQILHQIKDAYKSAIEADYVGKNLHNLFQKALEVGKKVRNLTSISENKVSIASAAVDLAKNLFGELSELKAMIIGAGEMANLVAVHLKDNGVKSMSFINRTKCRALELAKKYESEACSFENLNELLSKCDIVISSTSAPHTIITKEQIEKAAFKRKQKPLFMIDIAVPRDIEPECRNIKNVFLYDIDDLKNVVNESLLQRKEEAIKAMKIVNEETKLFEEYISIYDVAPKIKALSEKANNIRQSQLDSLFIQYPDLPDNIKEVIITFSKKLMGKWLHSQIVEIKEEGKTQSEKIENPDFLNLPKEFFEKLKTREMRNNGSERKIA